MSPHQLDAMLRESGLDAAGTARLAHALAPLEELADHAPAPSAALLLLLGEPAAEPVVPEVAPVAAPRPVDAVVVPLRIRGRRAVTGALLLALSGVGATGLSAAANTLPTPWQHHVSQFSQRYLPFDFPEPPTRLPGDRPLSGARSPGSTETRSLDSGRSAQAPAPGAPDGPSGEGTDATAGARPKPRVNAARASVTSAPRPTSTPAPSPSAPPSSSLPASASPAAYTSGGKKSSSPTASPSSPGTQGGTPSSGASGGTKPGQGDGTGGTGSSGGRPSEGTPTVAPTAGTPSPAPGNGQGNGNGNGSGDGNGSHGSPGPDSSGGSGDGSSTGSEPPGPGGGGPDVGGAVEKVLDDTLPQLP